MVKENKIESEFKDIEIPSFLCTDAIEISLFIEKEGLNFYEKAAKNVLEPAVKNMFFRLAEEEKEHIGILQNKLQILKPAIGQKSKANKKVSSFISKVLEGKVFPVFENNINKFKTSLEALDYGIESEKRSIEVLNGLLLNEKKLDVKTIFAHLVVEEKKHLLLLENLKADLIWKIQSNA